MARAYKIQVKFDVGDLVAGMRKAEEAAAKAEAAAGKVAKAHEAAHDKIDVGLHKLQVTGIKFQDEMVKAAERKAAAVSRVEDQLFVKEYTRNVKRAQAAEKAARKEVESAQKKLDDVQKVEDKLTIKEYNRNVRRAQDEVKAAQKRLDDATKVAADLNKVEDQLFMRDYNRGVTRARNDEKLARRKAEEIQRVEDAYSMKEYNRGVKRARDDEGNARRKADEIQRIEDAYAVKEYNRAVRRAQVDARAAQQKEEAVQKVEDRLFIKDYNRGVAKAKRDQDQAEQDAATREKIMDKWGAREHNRQVRAARKLQAEQEREAERSAKREADARVQNVDRAIHAVQAFGLFAVRAISEAFDAVDNRVKRAVDNVKRAEARLAMESTLKGEGMTTLNTLMEAGEFRLKTGMTEEEATRFTNQYMGSLPIGIQRHDTDVRPTVPGLMALGPTSLFGGVGTAVLAAKGGPKGISREVAKDVMVQAGIMAKRQGGDVGPLGELSGILGQFGQVKSVEDAMAQLEAIRVGLSQGRGLDPQLIPKLLQIASTVVDENEGGLVPDLKSMSVLLGMASLGPGQGKSATHTEQFVSAITKGLVNQHEAAGHVMSQARYLQSLGIKPGMPLVESSRRLADDIQKARDRGENDLYYLQTRGFQRREAFSTLEITKNQKEYEQRLRESEAPGLGDKAMGLNRDFMDIPQGIQAVGDVVKDVREKTQGIPHRTFTALKAAAEGSREVAEADMSPWRGYFKDIAASVLGGNLGWPSEMAAYGREGRVEGVAVEMMRRKAVQSGVPLGDIAKAYDVAGNEPTTFLSQSKFVNLLEDMVRQRGGNLRVDTNEAMTDLSKAVRENTRAIQAQGGNPAAPGANAPAGAPPALPPRPAPAGNVGRPG